MPLLNSINHMTVLSADRNRLVAFSEPVTMNLEEHPTVTSLDRPRRCHWGLLRRRHAVTTAVLFSACAGEAPRLNPVDSGSGAPASQAIVPIDSSIPPAIAGQDGWHYQLSADADLNGDGQPERVVLTARVEVIRGRPAWDDGQPWQVYIETPDGHRSYVYAQRLQLGSLTMRVGRSDAGQPATVVLLEHLPDRLGVYEAAYRGPDSVTVFVRFRRELDPRGEVASPRLP